jgi:tetratricopeptide (TPR) repeat protein
VQEAIGHWEWVLHIEPDDVAAHNNLGIALRAMGRIPDAIRHCEQALQINPNYAEAHYNLGLALAQQGNLQEAIKHWEQALLLRADYAEPHGDLGLAMEQAHKFREAIEHYDQALRVRPDYSKVQNNLAWLLAILPPAQGGDPVRATTLAERACAHTGNRVPPYLDTLAAAYAATGRFDEAVATAQNGIDLASAAGQLQVAEAIEAHQKLYRTRQPYHLSLITPESHEP